MKQSQGILYKRENDGRMCGWVELSKAVVSGGDGLSLVSWAAPEQESDQPWFPLRPGQSWDSGGASGVPAVQRCPLAGGVLEN